MLDNAKLLHILSEQVTACRRCPRLVTYLAQVSRKKRRAYRDWTYWANPVPGFGDPRAKLLIVGLAPGAHGSNRTGRPFTGDKSGEFLYKALYDAGFANQPVALHRDDGLQLHNAYITAAARCAPPDNKPLPSELLNCREYLDRELEILQPRAVLALGKIAWDIYLGLLKHHGIAVTRAANPFAHGAEFDPPATQTRLFGVYHPSQQNTSTGIVTLPMYGKVLGRIRRFLEKSH
jgi:uracil-DNA glycosylase